MPRLQWRELPWREGARLLLNRGTGLLLSRRRMQNPEEKEFIIFYVCSAQFARLPPCTLMLKKAKVAHNLCCTQLLSNLEQGTGIEPASSAWEADVLPMY